MAHENFRQSPIYQAALPAPDTMGFKQPHAWLRRRERDEDRDGARIVYASRRIDHLIRNAMRYVGPNDPYLCPIIISAMKAFVKHIDATLPAMAPRVPANVLVPFRHKVEFCREMIAASDRERAAVGLELTIPETFEDRIVRHGSTMRDVVYHNPFRNFYAGTTSTGSAIYASYSAALDGRMLAFHREMKFFWS